MLERMHRQECLCHTGLARPREISTDRCLFPTLPAAPFFRLFYKSRVAISTAPIKPTFGFVIKSTGISARTGSNRPLRRKA